MQRVVASLGHPMALLGIWLAAHVDINRNPERKSVRIRVYAYVFSTGKLKDNSAGRSSLTHTHTHSSTGCQAGSSVFWVVCRVWGASSGRIWEGLWHSPSQIVAGCPHVGFRALKHVWELQRNLSCWGALGV